MKAYECLKYWMQVSSTEITLQFLRKRLETPKFNLLECLLTKERHLCKINCWSWNQTGWSGISLFISLLSRTLQKEKAVCKNHVIFIKLLSSALSCWTMDFFLGVIQIWRHKFFWNFEPSLPHFTTILPKPNFFTSQHFVTI